MDNHCSPERKAFESADAYGATTQDQQFRWISRCTHKSQRSADPSEGTSLEENAPIAGARRVGDPSSYRRALELSGMLQRICDLHQVIIVHE